MVQINDQYVYVFDSNGFDNVLAIKNESSTDDDIVHFGFPITIVYPNYSEYKVTSQEQLDYIFSHYGDDSPYHEIKCVDFNFPLTIHKYDTNSQVSSSITIGSNKQFYNFVNDLEANEVVGFEFPIVLTKSGGQQITINNNSQLEDAIDAAVNSCNAAPSPMTLAQVMSNGTWHVSYCYYDYDETSYYSNYNFTFNPNGTCKAVKNSTNIMGDWDIQNDGSFQRLDLNFDGSQLFKLEAGWKVQEYTSTYVRLKRDSSGGGSNPCYYLYFAKN